MTDPLAGTPEEFTAAHWSETVGARHTGGEDHFSPDGDGESVLAGLVDNTRLRGAYRFCCGYNLVEGAGDGVELRRALPIRHPRWEELRCTAVSGRPFKPGSTGAPAAPSTVLKQYVPNAPTLPTFAYFSRYRRANIFVQFRPTEYDCYDDTNILYYQVVSSGGAPQYTIKREWLRFSEPSFEPRIQELSLEGFKLVYQEGAGNTAPVSNPQGTEFPAPFGQITVKSDFQLVTHRLPQDFLFPGTSLLPTNVLRALGKVNRFDWNGYPAGTLLFIAARLARKRWSLRAGTEQGFLWRLEAHFSHFDPTKGYHGNAPVTSRRGWNNFPFRGTLAAGTELPSAGDKNAGKWFFAVRTAGTSTDEAVDPPLIESADFAWIYAPVGKTFYDVPAAGYHSVG